MAVYKVPQDVEADDKLIGPFSFRQFIYLIVVAISMAGAWGLSQIFLALAILPLPVIVFFAALALPLRKDQPMEAYLSAVVSFYFLKSRKRFWQPDGIDTFITIIPPKDAEKVLTKELDETEATKRLGYLADLVDTHGWAIRGAGGTPDTSISTDLYYESQQTVDMMDTNTPSAQAMTQQLKQQADDQKQQAISQMKTAGTTPAAATTSTPAPPADNTAEPVSTLPSLDAIKARQNAAIEQQQKKAELDAIAYANALIEQASDERSTPAPAATPVTPPKTAPAVTTSATPVAKSTSNPTNTSVSTPQAGTMELTHEQADELSKQTDVSVQTLAKEANRVAEKNKVLHNGDEVTISFH